MYIAKTWDVESEGTGHADFQSDVSVVTPNKPAFGVGRVIVAAAGTPVQGSDFTGSDGFPIIVMANPDNAGNISFGPTSAEALYASALGFVLEPGDSMPMKVTNLNLVWFDSQVNDDQIQYYVEQDS